MITSTMDRTRNLSRFKLKGDIEPSDIFAAIDAHYAEYPIGDSLWDFTGASMHNFDSGVLTEVANFAKRYGERKGNGLTVILVERKDRHMLMKLYKSIAEIVGCPINYQIAATEAEVDELLDEHRKQPVMPEVNAAGHAEHG